MSDQDEWKTDFMDTVDIASRPWRGEPETKATVITPGGRVGNDARHGSRTNGENWVERTAGELPEYIRIVRNGLMKQGHDEARATALAVAAMKRWARGGDNVSPKVQAAAAAALAKWEAMKAESHGKKSIEVRIAELKTGRRADPNDIGGDPAGDAASVRREVDAARNQTQR